MRIPLSIMGTASLLALTITAGYFVSVASVDDRDHAGSLSQLPKTAETDPSSANANLIPKTRPDIFYAAITDRPLFAQTRRPLEQVSAILEQEEVEPMVVEAPAPVEDVALPEPDAVLLGVLSGGAHNSALISLEGADPRWVREGADIAGWRLDAITADAIRLGESERSLIIELYRK